MLLLLLFSSLSSDDVSPTALAGNIILRENSPARARVLASAVCKFCTVSNLRGSGRGRSSSILAGWAVDDVTTGFVV